MHRGIPQLHLDRLSVEVDPPEKMKTYYIAQRKQVADRCPHCGETVDSITGIYSHLAAEKEQRPRPRDFTICLYCAGLCVFGAMGEMLITTEEQLAKTHAIRLRRSYWKLDRLSCETRYANERRGAIEYLG